MVDAGTGSAEAAAITRGGSGGTAGAAGKQQLQETGGTQTLRCVVRAPCSC